MEDESSTRAKRQKLDKKGRFAALQKLKELKQHGRKHKAELSDEIENVYDLVDETEYIKRQSTLGQDWIEDDGTGYTEDGRDIFDEIDSNNSEDSTDNQKKRRKKRTRKAGISDLKSAHRSLFSKKLYKPKIHNNNIINLEQDNALADILVEIKESGNDKQEKRNHKMLQKECKNADDVEIKEYMDKFMKSLKNSQEEPKVATDDDKIVENILKPGMVTFENKLNIKQNFDLEEQDNSIGKIQNKESSTIRSFDKTNSNHDITKTVSEEYHEFVNKDDGFDNDYLLTEKSILETQKVHPGDNNLSSNKDEEELKTLLNNWVKICKFDEIEELNDKKCQEPSLENIGKNPLKFYYWDAWEDVLKRPGEVFLFGKVFREDKSTCKSVCVHVTSIERVLYLLPREYIFDPIVLETTKQKATLMDVYNEFANEIAPKLGIKEFKSEKVSKNFAFQIPGIDVPESCEYIEVRYDGKRPAPEVKYVYRSIAHIFGTNTSFLETFLLESKIKGPSWLSLNNFAMVNNQLSWCKIEVVCSASSIKHIEEKPMPSPPPMTIIALNLKSVVNPKTRKNEISIISCCVNDKFAIDKPPNNPPFNRHFCGITLPANLAWPYDFQRKFSTFNFVKASKFDSERCLLSWFIAIYQNIDPDLVVMFDVNDCQLDLICERVASLKIPTWSRFGRLKFSHLVSKKWKDFFNGRIICDVKTSAEELIKSRSYDLDTLCQNVLKLKENDRIDFSDNDIIANYDSSDRLFKYITLTMQDCSYVLRLMCEMNVLPLALQITTICGNLMSRTLQGGRSERNEFLLLHAFHEKNYIIPDKKKRTWDHNHVHLEEEENSQNKTVQGQRKKKAAFSGGLVLEPIKGLYDKYVLLMDFNSLYPSIIQEFNICFTTVSEPEKLDEIPPLPDSNVEQGILPRQIRRLVESRREVKKLMATADLDPVLKSQYNIRQLALKLTANSMYGCLGFAQSRFYAQHLASLTTSKGREILMNTKSLVQKLNFEVVYGDTDSIMINTNSTDYEQVFKIGNSIKQIINKLYRQIELEIDGVFKNLLLLKKKKYAAIAVSKNSKGEFIYQKEIKGLDIIRRDWSQVAIMAGKIVLDEILSDKSLDEKLEAIHSHLEKLKINIVNGIYSLPLLTITKQLTKAPQEYSNGLSNLPHAIVAKRMNSTKNKRYKKGDAVAYIICDDGTQNTAMQRAYHLDELKYNEKLKVDTNYYLAQQIHPVIMRLCEPLEGIDGAVIAECLGLDPKKYKSTHKAQSQINEEVGAGESISKTTLQKYRQCEKFKFTCINCKTVNTVASAFKPHEKAYVPVLQTCSNTECKIPLSQYLVSIRNQMILTIRNFIKRFYDNWMICDEPSCNTTTRKLTHTTVNNRAPCLACNTGTLIRMYSERDLYYQITYFQYIFDLSKHEQKNSNLSADIEIAFNTLRETIDNILDKSAYCSVNLNKLFTGIRCLSQDTIPSKHN